MWPGATHASPSEKTYMKNNIIVNFCPTGMVPGKSDNASVPIDAHEIIEQVHAAWELGITIAHLHARDENGQPDWRPERHLPFVEGIRKHCPGLAICLSTSGRKVIEFEKRSAVIDLKPELCSLTLGSNNFVDQASINPPKIITQLYEKMNANGVLAEFECFHMGMINYGLYLRKKYNLDTPAYWNLLFGNIGGFQAEFLEMGTALARIPQNDFVAIAGLGNQQLKANSLALANGIGVRVGLEDNLFFDAQKKIPATNLMLLKRIHDLLKIHDRKVLDSGTFMSQIKHPKSAENFHHSSSL